MTENEKIMLLHHQEWLQQPMTKTLLRIIDKHESSVADKLAGSAMDKDVQDDHIRRLATQLATTKTIRKLIYDSETFVAKSSNS